MPPLPTFRFCFSTSRFFFLLYSKCLLVYRFLSRVFAKPVFLFLLATLHFVLVAQLPYPLIFCCRFTFLRFGECEVHFHFLLLLLVVLS